MFVVSEAWTTSFSGATAGFLAMRGVTNPDRHAGLDERARLLEAELRQRFAGIDRAASFLPPCPDTGPDPPRESPVPGSTGPGARTPRVYARGGPSAPAPLRQ